VTIEKDKDEVAWWSVRRRSGRREYNVKLRATLVQEENQKPELTEEDRTD